MGDEAAIAIQDQRVRHADTQAAGIMALTATALGVLGAGNGFKLGDVAEPIVSLGLFVTFFCATAARLADILWPFQPRGDEQDRDSSNGRSRVAYRKGKWIAGSLVGLLVAAAAAGLDVFL